VASEYFVGPFQVRPAQRRVVARGHALALGARAFDLLLVLIERRDRVVGKDELLALVWPGVVVEEGNLAVQISTLRKLLGSGAVSTIPGRGYQFTAPVTEDGAGDAHAQPGTPAPRQVDYEELIQKLRRPGGAATEVEPAENLPGHLPAAMTPLLGRATALQETRQLLCTTRCLTLTGAGGSGKTRLALALAEGLRPDYPGGAWWVELDRLSDPKALAATVAHSLGVPDSQASAVQALEAHLKGRRTLLVLDNCEHLIDACAELASHLLRELPLLQLLATSRESLRIAGEVAWSVPPLEVPASSAHVRLEDLLQLASAQLLVQRIRQHDPKFVPTQEHAASLAQICRGLEGLPLALELVAAQIGPQTLAQVASRLDRSLPLLSIGQRGDVPHHQTMTAAVDWGYQLLGDTEAALFLRLSVFAGGWTPQGAQAVCDGLGLTADDLTPLLARLHRVSMVLAIETDGALRFRMLEPIRQFAFAKLGEQGLADTVKRALLAWYVERAKAVAAQLTGPQQALGYAFLNSEVDNIRALLSWSLQAAISDGLRLAAELWRFWQVKGHAKEMLNWFEQALPLAAEVPTRVRADASNSAGVMARTCGLYDAALRLHDAALVLQRELGNRRGEAVALNNLCVVARDRYDHPAVERLGRASLLIAREIGDRNLEGLGLMHLGTALRGQGRAEEAQASFEQSLDIFGALGERRAMAALHNYLGNLALAAGRWAQAGRCFDESLELNRALDDFWGLGISTLNQATLQFATSAPALALPKLMQSFAHYRRAGAKHGLEECFELLAQIALAIGQLDRAAWCWGVVDRLELDIEKVLTPDLKRLREQALHALEARMPGELLDAARAIGRRDSLEDSLCAVLSDTSLAGSEATS